MDNKQISNDNKQISNDNKQISGNNKQIPDYKYEIRLSVDGTEIDHEAIRQLFTLAFRGELLELTGDSSCAVIDYCTNEPWKVLEFCSTFGEMHHITVKNRKTEAV